MSTPFSDVYSRFLRKITDYRLANLIQNDPTTYDNRMYGWMESAIPKFSKCNTDLSARDTSLKTFTNTLTESEQEILSNYMVVEWLDPEVKSIMDMQNVLFNDDWRTYSNANLLTAKQDMLNKAIERSDDLMVKYTYDTIDFSQFGAN